MFQTFLVLEMQCGIVGVNYDIGSDLFELNDTQGKSTPWLFNYPGEYCVQNNGIREL